MATLFVDKIDPQSGTSLEIGSSGDTITIPSGATITNNGTQTGFGGTNTPAFRASRGSNQTVSNATDTVILFDTENYDTDSAYDPSTGRFTVPSGEAGKYLITANLRFNSSTSNRNALDIKINDSSSGATASEWTSGQYGTLILTTTYVLSVGDFINVRYYQSSGGSIEVRTESFFSAHKLIGF